MATKSQVIKMAAELGVLVEDDSDRNDHDIMMTVPKACFKGTGEHTVHIVVPTDFGGPKSECWAFLLDILKVGIEPCKHVDCEICAEV